MNIALVHPRFGRQGGTERYGWDLARALLTLGDDVHLVARHVDDPVPGAHIHRVHTLAPGKTLRMREFAWRSARLLQRLKQQDPALLVLGLGRTLQQDLLRVGGGCHRAYLEAMSAPASPMPGWHDRQVLTLEQAQLSLTHTRCVLAVSHQVKRELLQHYPNTPPDAIQVVHNGVDISRFDPARLPEPAQLRQQWGIDPRAFVLLFVGNGLSRKGYQETLLIAEALATRQPTAARRPIALVVVGGDALRDSRLSQPFLNRQPQHQVQLLRVGQQADVTPFMHLADALLLPTRYEPFGNVCLEAMAMGCPALTCQQNGASEVFGPHLQPLILPAPLPIDPWVDALLPLLDPSQLATCRDAARAAAQSHTVLHNARAVREILQQLLLNSLNPAQNRI